MYKSFTVTSATDKRYLVGVLDYYPLIKLFGIMLILLAVDYHRAVLRLWVLVHHLPHPAPELQQGVAEGVGVTRPLRVVELDHLALLPVLPQTDCPGHRQYPINNLGQK